MTGKDDHFIINLLLGHLSSLLFVVAILELKFYWEPGPERNNKD